MRYLRLFGSVVAILFCAQTCAEEKTPQDYRFGIGVGYQLPTNVQTPNVAVASFYYKGLEIQPSIVFQNTTSTSDDGVTTTKDSSKTSGIGATIKYPFSRRDNRDLQAIGSFSYSKSTQDPDGPDNATTSKSKSISYGLGVQWWFASGFSLMVTATNPIYQDTQTRAETVGGATTTHDRSYGLVWDPTMTFTLMTWF